MDAFEKQICLYVTRLILIYHANNLVFEDPVYSSTQPSKSLRKSLLKFLFYDEMLDLVPHVKDGIVYDLENVNVHILFSILGRYWIMSKYKFVNELEYLTLWCMVVWEHTLYIHDYEGLHLQLDICMFVPRLA